MAVFSFTVLLGNMSKPSLYFLELQQEHPAVAVRYQEKLQAIDGIDPFAISPEEMNFDAEVLPPITSMDIVAYLVLTHSFYTKEQMKAFKSLAAYKYFDAGFVIEIGTIKINTRYVLVGKVSVSSVMFNYSIFNCEFWYTPSESLVALSAHQHFQLKMLLTKTSSRHFKLSC